MGRCVFCGREFHRLGLASHRAACRRRVQMDPEAHAMQTAIDIAIGRGLVVHDAEFTAQLMRAGFRPSEKYTDAQFLMNRCYYEKDGFYIGDMDGRDDLRSKGLVMVWRAKHSPDRLHKVYNELMFNPEVFDMLVKTNFGFDS